jgi:HAD superfamily hydrolase (TIGR01549 family)
MLPPAAAPPRAIVFDLWNTLAYNDHRPNPIIALGRAFGLLGRPGWTKALENSLMLRPLSGIEEGIACLSRDLGLQLPAEEVERLARLWNEACGRTRLFEDVPGTLRDLSARLPLGLLSNTQSFDLDFLEEGVLGSAFQARILSCHAGLLKPDPELFRRMAGRLRLDPAEILMVGDNLQDDVLAAEAVGMRAVLVRRREAPLSFQEQAADRVPLATIQPLLALSGG